MVLPTMTPAEPERKPQAATTTAEAATTGNPYLCLSSLKLSQLPTGLEKLHLLTHLDLSNNAITSIPEKSLPRALLELTLTGCQLIELPATIGEMPRLKKLFAGANRLRQIDCVFESASLQHVGLAYNCLAVLPPPEVLAGSPLLSLDLSYNDLEGLAATLTQLASLPSLAALSLGGNPLSLCPRYVADTKGRLKQLMFLDGQRLDLPANSRPGSSASMREGGASFASNAQPSASMRHQSTTFGLPDGLRRGGGPPSHAGSLVRNGSPGGPGGAPGLGMAGRTFGGGGGGGGFSPHTTVHFVEAVEGDGGDGGEGTAVELTLSGLAPTEDPFGWIKGRWAEQIAAAEAAAATVPPVLDVPVPPLQPVVFHVEVADVEGTPVCCVPLRIEPPTPPDVFVMFDPKAKAAAAAAAAKEAKAAGKPKSPKGKAGSARGKKKAAAEEEAGGVKELEQGLLRLTMQLQAVAAHRDWLRSGASITLHKTTLTAVPKPTPAGGAEESSSPPRTPNKQATRKKKGDEPPPVEYDITSSTELVGTALLRAGQQVVDGYTTEGFERLDFRPPPPLFDDKGLRLPLKDGRHPTHVVAAMEAQLLLHPQNRVAWEGAD